jgi:hypothetical protein
MPDERRMSNCCKRRPSFIEDNRAKEQVTQSVVAQKRGQYKFQISLKSVFYVIHQLLCYKLSLVCIVTDCGLDGQGLIPSKGKRFFTLYSIQIGSGAHPPSYPMGSWASFSRGKAPGADCSPPTSVEVKNGGAIPPLFPYIFMAWCLII